MPEMPVDLDIERLKNLVSGFGWTIAEKTITKDKITVVLEKSVKSS